MEQLGNAWTSSLSGLTQLAGGADRVAETAPGGRWGASLIGLSALSDLMGAMSRSSQASRMDDLRKRILSPEGNEELTRQVLTNLARFGVSADSGMAKQFVARALAESQLQRVQAASGMIPPGAGSTGATGNTMLQLMTLAGLAKAFDHPGLSLPPTTASSTAVARTGVSTSPDIEALELNYGM